MIIMVVIRIIIHAHAIVVLLLLLMGSRGSMHMSLILQMGIRMRDLIVMALLLRLMHPWLGLGELLLVGEYMLVLHPGGEAKCFRPTI